MWTRDIKSKVFTVIQVETRKEITKRYPTKTNYQKVTFTANDKSDTPATFPNVYLKEMQGAETGRDLSNKSINFVYDDYQIEVTDNASPDTTADIADIVGDIMVEQGFEMIGRPFQDNSDGSYRNVSRWRRLLGSGNKY